MPVITKSFKVSTKGFTDIINITNQVADVIATVSEQECTAVVFIGGSTAGITTIEFEPGLLKDLPEAFEKIAPSDKYYYHDETWGDGNGMAHVRAALLGCSLSVPVSDGNMILGTWQQIVLIDFDNRSRNRNVIVQIQY